MGKGDWSKETLEARGAGRKAQGEERGNGMMEYWEEHWEAHRPDSRGVLTAESKALGAITSIPSISVTLRRWGSVETTTDA